MPLFLPVSTRNNCAIAICDRCKKKVPYSELRPDGNSPGLMVCQSEGCWDQYDPWRLPARQTEKINLKHPRPDEPLEVNDV